METRRLERRETFSWPDIQRLIRDNDLTDYDTFLVLNGGTGTGKTSAIMRQVRDELEQKFLRPQTMLVVESRTATVDQLNINYNDYIERINGVDVCQRITFMHQLQHNTINYDWIVIDECHGLFSEASFAEDAGFIASWIKNRRKNTHIIFVTANDEYFAELSQKFFSEDFNFIYLFPDFTHYVSNTYVKEIQFIKTNRTDDVIGALLAKLRDQKGIVFLKRASDVKDWFFRMLDSDMRAGMIVSKANETNAALTIYQQKQAQDAAINISDGKAGFTMADLCDLFNAMRRQLGKEDIRQAINNERLPEDIDVLLATDTIQEGISIKSSINYIIIEGFTEVEVRQKLGRFRGNLGTLYIVFNPTAARNRIFDKLQTFDSIMRLYEENNQTALAEFYGRQQASKSAISFLIKENDSETGISFYKPNIPAMLNCKSEFHLYTALVNDTEATVQKTYTYPLLNGAPKILNYNDDIKTMNTQEAIMRIADKWKGIPLKGKAQEELVEDFKKEGITDKTRHAITTFRGCCTQFNNYGIKLTKKRATKKDLILWPEYLTTIKESYNFIE